MKILWVHNFNPNTLNSGNFMHISADGLRNKGIEVDLHNLGDLRSISNMFKAHKNLKKISKNYDLIHAQYGSACAFITSSIKDVPKIVTLRGSDWHKFKGEIGFRSLHGTFATFMTKVAIDKFNCVISVSNRIKNEVSSKYPYLKVITIPSPIDLEKFKPMNMQECRKQLGFENDHDYWVLFTTVHKTNPIKRLELAEKAVEIASISLEKRVKIRVASGIPHDKMPIFISACNIVLCTSTHEGWPNSVKEALACNLPFVSTDVSDLAIIAEKEKNCRICPPDPYVIAKNISDILTTSNHYRLNRHISSMNLSDTSDNLISLYSKILKLKMT